ncbi:MAG: cytochrome P450 [Myxococcota bacterium]
MPALRAPPPLPGIPAPDELPVVGSLLGFARDPIAFLQGLQRDHGDLVQLTLADHRVLLVSDPDLLETVFVTEWRNLHKDAIYDKTRPMLGNGLVTSEGDAWKRNRKLAAPSFTPRHIELYRATMQRCVDTWIAAQPDQAEIDLAHEMMGLTRDIVLETLFGGDLDLDVSVAGHAIEAFMDEFVVEVRGWRRFAPDWLPSPGRRRAQRAVAALDDLIARVLAARRAKGLGDDLLSQLLSARDEDGHGLDDRQLRDEAVTMFAAGHETTATALTYALLLLASHPEEQRRLAQSPERAEAVLKEAMRLLPPVWAVGRETQAAIRLGEHDVPAGTQILVAQCVLNRNPTWFPDPDAFRPDRWLDGGPDLPRFAYLPFGGGPRVCIGNHFAMMEGTLLLSAIVSAFDTVALGPVPPPMTPSITLRPRGAIPARISHRAGIGGESGRAAT